MNYFIREFSYTDLRACIEIEYSSFSEGVAFHLTEVDMFIKSSDVALVATVDNLVVGYALARAAFGIGYLYSNAVLFPYRKKGIGTALVKERLRIMSHMRLIQAHTDASNQAGATILQKNGFISVAYIPDYYAENKDGVLWEKRK